MPVELVTIPCLTDNYAYLLHNAQTKHTALIDAPEAAPIQAVLDDRGWNLTDILITHHHPDHIDGVPTLRNGTRVIGPAADAHRLPPLDMAVKGEQGFRCCDELVQVIDVPGHSDGHIAFYLPDAGLLFSADSLMAMGCGRLFEGTPAQMWDSLQKLRALPRDTTVCSGHEYTSVNARFAASLEPENEQIISRMSAVEATRAQGKPTVPSTLSTELCTNPFLRADDPALAAAIGMAGADALAVFTEIRSRRDKF